MDALKFYESAINMGGGVMLPVRSTLVSFKSGRRLLISPLRFSEEQLNDLKKVAPDAIAAPNCFHHLFAKKAAEALGIKTLYAAPGLNFKRPDVAWTEILDEAMWPFHDELQLICVEGAPKVNECVFYHRESKTLIVTDLFFNFKNLPGGLKTLIYRVFGTFNRPASSRLLYFLVKDKQLFRESMQKILQLDFNRIVMAHGEILSENAKEILKAALAERGLA